MVHARGASAKGFFEVRYALLGLSLLFRKPLVLYLANEMLTTEGPFQPLKTL